MNKQLFLSAALLICFFASTLSIFAAHLVGGELSYTCLGDDNYRIELVIYRDCNCVGCADFDDPAHITIFDGEGNLVEVTDMFSPIITQLPVETEDLCLEAFPDVCVERGYYEVEVALPPSSNGYQVVHQRCCRNNTIDNLLDPGSQGSTYLLNVPPLAPGDACNNSAPQFTNFPPIVICANSPLIFDHSATDLDGDSLVYSICEPYLGASTVDPYPDEASFPPYQTVEWLAPYSDTYQLASEPAMVIDPNTGLLTAFPNALGQFVVGICVSEYRDGVLLSVKTRDFQFNVADCVIVEALAGIDIGDNDTICLGENVQLVGQAFSADSWYWEPAFSLNNSDILNPVAAPTTTTTYTLTVVNLTAGCGATSEVTIHVVDPITANAGDDQTFCPGQTVQLDGSGGDVYSWSPIDGLSDPNIANPIANPTTTTTYTLTVADASGSCFDSDEMTISVGSSGDPGDMPDDQVVLCDGGTTDLAATGVQLDEGSVLGYIIHTTSDDTPGTILGSNAIGVFAYTGSPMLYNTIYYVSSVVGPPDAGGLPDLSNGCTRIAPGTPVVFLSPLQLLINEYCDWQFTGDLTITVGASGSYPAYANTDYIVGGSLFNNLPITTSTTVQTVVNEGQGTHSYMVTLDDSYCPAITQVNTFVCFKTAVELTRFLGEALPEGNNIMWTTATETDNNYFTLQRSTDGNNFVPIATIDGAGTSLSSVNYSFLDKTAAVGVSYYRLIQTDFNGTSTQSEVAFVIRQAVEIDAVVVKPMPAREMVEIVFNNQTAAVSTIRIYDATGRLLATQQTQNNTYQLNITSYSQGLYFIAVQTGDEVKIAKMVKN